MIYALAFISTFVLTFIVRKITLKKSLLDIPNERSSHSVPTPTGGGLAIVIVWYVALSFFYFESYISQELYFALLPGIIIAAIGFCDDIFGLSPKVRLFFQALMSVLALFFLGGLQKIDLGFFVFDNVYILSLFAFFGIIWFINLFNFLDGIDGYEASEVIFISLALFYFTKNPATLLLAVVCLGFLFWNWQKAKIFMGDVGSTLLGYTIIVLFIHFQNNENFSLVNSLVLSSIFWFDATLTLIRRKLNGEKLSQAHKKHAYQRLNQSGWSHAKVCTFAMLTNILLFVIVLFVENIWVSFLISIILLFGVMKFVDGKKKFE